MCAATNYVSLKENIWLRAVCLDKNRLKVKNYKSIILSFYLDLGALSQTTPEISYFSGINKI